MRHRRPGLRLVPAATALVCATLLLTGVCRAEVNASQTWPVDGRVVDVDGAPVAGAIVSIPRTDSDKSNATPSVTTDSDGFFQIDSPIAPAGLILLATHDGGRQLAYKRLDWKRRPDSVVLPVELVLRAPRAVAVAVRDSQEQPVADAKVVAVADFRIMDRTTSAKDGRAKLHVPADAPLSSVVVVKPGVGVDYFLFRDSQQPASDPYQLAHDHSGELAAVLNGTRRVEIRVVDEQDRPLAGQRLYPWQIRLPDKGDDLNLSGLNEFTVETDDSGVATFEVIPIGNQRGVITFWINVPGYSRQRVEYKMAAGDTELVAKQQPLVSLSGIAKFADGRPAPSIEIKVAGAGYTKDDFRGAATTDESGRFQVDVDPDQYYQIAAGNREWASAPVNRLILSRKPVADVELALTPAKRIIGRVTIGDDHKPVAGSYIELYQLNAVDYYDLPESQRLPNPTDSNLGIQPLIVQSSQTDAAGAFEFFTGPGKYYLIGPSGVKPPHFELQEQPSLEVHLHADRPDSVPITGRVVLQGDPQQGVPNVAVTGYAKQSRLRDLRAASGPDGRFAAERGPSEMVVYAATPDRKLAGIVTISPDDAEIVIPIGTTSSAHARLLDEETQAPLANRKVDYGVWIQFEDGTFSWRFGGDSTTDENGELTIDNLVVGQEYMLEAVAETSVDGSPRLWSRAGKVTATSTAVAEMGDVLVERPYREPTTAERVTKLFADKQSLDERISARARDAGFGYQNVLLVAGDPENSLIQQLYEYEYDESLDDAAMNYLFLPVNTRGPENTSTAEQALASRGITLPVAGDATLAVLDKSGKLMSQIAANQLTTEGKIDTEKLREFLVAHAPQLPNAETLYAAALEEAKRDDKRVFVQCSGPRCGWCTVLSRFVDDHAELFKKEFVYLKLDSRLAGGQAVIERVRPTAQGGIPWFVFLDPAGQPLINSEGPDGNIGYPGESESRAHFEKMLRTHARHLTDADIASIIAALSK